MRTVIIFSLKSKIWHIDAETSAGVKTKRFKTDKTVLFRVVVFEETGDLVNGTWDCQKQQFLLFSLFGTQTVSVTPVDWGNGVGTADAQTWNSQQIISSWDWNMWFNCQTNKKYLASFLINTVQDFSQSKADQANLDWSKSVALKTKEMLECALISI